MTKLPNTNDTIYGPLIPLILNSRDVMFVNPITYYPPHNFGFYFIIILMCIGILLSFTRPFYWFI